MKYIVSFLLLPIVLTAEKINYQAPGKVRQTTFEACKVDLSPGEKYFTAKRQWQGCPTILCTPRGTLYAGWYSGGVGEGLLNYSILSRSKDGGFSWTREPLLVIDSLPEKRIQFLDCQFWLDPDGNFWYFWTQRDYNYPPSSPHHVSVWAIICSNPDAENLSWSKPRFITPGFLRSQPTVLNDGRWVLCAYEWIDKNYRYTESYDKGKSWYRRKGGRKHPTDFDETMLLEQKDGTLRMLARCRKSAGVLAESTSTDGGKTWNTALTAIPNPGSRFFIKRLRSGRILLVNNWHNKERICLSAALSEDDGKTWKHRLLLDNRRCSYPDAVQGKNDEIYIVYDNLRSSAKEILICRITEEDIIKGRRNYNLTVRDSYLGQIINKAPWHPELTDAEKALSERYRHISRNKDANKTKNNPENKEGVIK